MAMLKTDGGWIRQNTPALVKLAEDATARALRAYLERAQSIARDTSPYDTGNLRRSVDFKQADLGFEFFTATGYGAFVELGTARMPARPFMRQALDAAGQQMKGKIQI